VALYDLRSPLGIAPAALKPLQQPAVSSSAQGISPFSYNPAPPSLQAARVFAAQRSSLRAKVARSGQVSPARQQHERQVQISTWVCMYCT
jgi:hypothetical protein